MVKTDCHNEFTLDERFIRVKLLGEKFLIKRYSYIKCNFVQKIYGRIFFFPKQLEVLDIENPGNLGNLEIFLGLDLLKSRSKSRISKTPIKHDKLNS